MKFSPEKSCNRVKCTGCGICERVCPSNAIEMHNGSPYFISRFCIACGHCGVYCPANCFGFEPAPQQDEICSAGDYRKLLEVRRSVRIFSDRMPSEEEIRDLLSILSQSPTGVNAQGITVRVVSGMKAVGDLLRPVKKLLRVLDCTGISFLIGKISGRSEHLKEFRLGNDIIFRGAPVVLFFHVPKRNITGRADGIIAATTVMHHATALGMGTLWNGIAEKLYPIISSWHSKETGGTRLTAVLCIGYSELTPEWKIPSRGYRIVSDSCSCDV